MARQRSNRVDRAHEISGSARIGAANPATAEAATGSGRYASEFVHNQPARGKATVLDPLWHRSTVAPSLKRGAPVVRQRNTSPSAERM